MGTTWNLVKCPECEQEFAYKKPGGFVPDEVVADDSVEVVEQDEIILHAH